MFLRRIIGHYISRLIMPAQNYPKTQGNKPSEIVEDVHLTYFSTPSTRNAQIDFCEYKFKPQKKFQKNQRIIIHAKGNINTYEEFKNEYIEKAKRFPNDTIVSFNFRNVKSSTGIAYSEEDWIEDAIAVVEYYRHQGIPTENILLNGYSLGGAILTMAAAKIYRQDKSRANNPNQVKSVKLINDRSFSNLSEMVMHLYLAGKRKAFLNGFIYAIALTLSFSIPISIGLGCLIALLCCISESFSRVLIKPWVKLSLWLGFGTMNAGAAYDILPEDAKDYIVAKNDINIGDKPSLHEKLKPLRSARRDHLRQKITTSSDKQEKKKFEEALNNLKDCKLEGTNNINVHSAPLTQLKTYHRLRSTPLNGEQVVDNKTKQLFNVRVR